ncbi:MAG TPA: type II toxin-antitoxin system RelE/ParE family toxin [Phycisphaerae bacterium]|jgi:toxin ParE1/3/4
MTPVLIIRPEATQLLIEHYLFILQDKILPADRFLEVTDESFHRLAKFPNIGKRWISHQRRLEGVRVYPLPPPYRKYLVFYKSIENGIEILTVLYGMRDIPNQLTDI